MDAVQNISLFLSFIDFSLQKSESIMKSLTQNKDVDYILDIIAPILIHLLYLFELPQTLKIFFLSLIL